jgi:N-formylglutamate amidohydrolase
MSDVPVYFSVGDDNEQWLGIPRARALEWTRAFLRRQPSVPGTVIWMVRPNLEKGVPAGFTDWARRAHEAEAIGFTPDSYEALHAALDDINAERFPSHPDNHRVKQGLKEVRPFDAERWASWNRLVADGVTPIQATERLLRLPTEGPDGLLHMPLSAPGGELGSTIDFADYSFASPVVLHAPHGGSRIPLSCLDAFTISEGELAGEHQLLVDHWTDRMVLLSGVTARMASRLSRLVVDVERFEGDAEEMNRVGMGVLYTRGSHGQPIRVLDPAEEERLLAHFRSYGELFARLVDRALEHHGRAVILDVHSYPAEPLPYELHQDDRRPELCIGVDELHTPPALVAAVRAAFDGWDLEVNQPFRGTYVPLRHLGDPRVSSVMLEIRRDRYLDEDGRVIDAAVRDVARRIRTIVAVA